MFAITHGSYFAVNYEEFCIKNSIVFPYNYTMQPSQQPTQRKSLTGHAHYLHHRLKRLMCGINVITLQFNKNIRIYYKLHLITLICNYMVWLINKLQFKIYLYFFSVSILLWNMWAWVFCLVHFVLKFVSVTQI